MTFLIRLRTMLGLILLISSVLQSPGTAQVANVQADAEAEAASPAANDAYADAANSQNQGDFAKAAMQWETFVNGFGDDPLIPVAKHYRAVCLIQSGQYSDAIKVLEALLKSKIVFDQVEESYINLGWAHYMVGAQGNPSALNLAAGTLAKYVREFPQGKLVDQALFYQAESLYQAGEVDQAVTLFDQLVTEHPKSPLRAEALYALATSRQELGQRISAIKNLEKFIEKYSDHTLIGDVHFRLAHAYQQDNELATAAEYYGKASESETFESADQAIYQKAYCLASLQRFEESAAEYVHLVEDFADSPLAHQATLEAGRCYYRCDRLEDASRWLRLVIESNQITRIEAAHWLNRIYLQQEDLELATRVARAAIDWSATSEARRIAMNPKTGKPEFPFLDELKLDYAQTLGKISGQYDAALDAFSEVYDDKSDSRLAPQALFQAAQLANANGKHEKSIELTGEFMRRFKDHELARKVTKLKANGALLVEEPQVAENAARELIAANVDKESPEIRVKLAQVLYSNKKYAEAIKAVGNINDIKNAEDRAKVWHLVGDSHLKLQQYSQAISALASSLKSDSDGNHVPQVLHRLARACGGDQQHKHARKTYEILLRDFPTHPRCEAALFELAEIELADQDHVQAVAHYVQLLKNYPDSNWMSDAILGKGMAQMGQSQFASAISSFTTLLDLGPEERIAGRAKFLRGVCRQKVGNHRASIADIEEFLESNPSLDQRSDAQLTWSVCQIELGKWEAAEETLNKIIEENPSYPRADQVVYYAGWSALSRDDLPLALEYFSQVVSEYPGSRLAAESHFHLGDYAYGEAQFDQSLRHFQEAYDLTEDDGVKEKSAYKLGWSHYHLGQYEPARANFSLQISDYPDGDFAPDGKFMMAECFVKLGSYEDAIKIYQQLKDHDGLKDDALELVHLHAGQTLNRMQKHEQALSWLVPFTKKFPESSRIATAEYEAGLAHRSLGQLKAAIDSLGSSARNDSDEIGARARYYLGNLFAANKQLGRAMREYQALMYGYGGESASEAVKKWQSKAGLEAGKSASLLAASPARRNKDIWLTRANKFFRFVLDRHPESESAMEAREQLQRLAELPNQRRVSR